MADAPKRVVTEKTLAEAPYIGSADDRRAEQEAEFSEWVAIEPVDIGGVRAFNPGDAVSRTHVRLGIVQESQVARRTTKAAAGATAEASPTP